MDALEYFKLYTKQKLSISDIPELPDKVFNISAGLTKFTILNAQFSQEIDSRQPTIVCSFILANSEHKRTKIEYFIHLLQKTTVNKIFLAKTFFYFEIGYCCNNRNNNKFNKICHPCNISYKCNASILDISKKWQCGLVHYLKILCDDISHYF